MPAWYVDSDLCKRCDGKLDCCSRILVADNPVKDTEVPGGQTLYVEASGALGFTQAHSAEVPPGATVGGFVAYESGEFVLSGTTSWLACPASPSQQSVGQEYQIFAPLAQVSFPEDCFPLEMLTVDWNQSQGPAAWQYT